MNREEYLKRLSFLLKDLPKEEIEDAIAYYEDYFEEAGEEKEEQVIKELGSPEKIAKMIRDSVQENQASSEYTEEGYRQETYEDYQQMSRKDSQKEAKQGSRWHMKGRRNRNIILMILILVFVGSWLIPGIFGIVIGIQEEFLAVVWDCCLEDLDWSVLEFIRCLRQFHMVYC